MSKRILITASNVLLMALLVCFGSAGSHAATTTSWTADGPSIGLGAYKIIQNALGSGAIESPDVGPKKKCHTSVKHIQENTDPVVGNAFTFYLHQDKDCDPTNEDTEETRERVEIKVYEGSKNTLKAFQGDHMKYTWRFKISNTMLIGERFTHLFQLKSVGGSQSSHPLLTFTGAKGKFEVRHGENDTILGPQLDWSTVKGLWLEASVDAVFSHYGKLTISIKEVASCEAIYSYTGTLDMFKDGDYINAKWGIFRENKDLNLNDATVKFANFLITKY